ncbi:hypothetical protein AB4391_01330 [Vibrio lentus]|uniref:PilZ domain-containing protein n=1 Tax=Vibrio lentus TaxID=136468 RepID=A0A2N7KP23_9VIBR|nr:hypothetical protein [Vibrio lentus]PMM78464.1 hypothetical protein BCT49_00200 [Vibrio lentus]
MEVKSEGKRYFKMQYPDESRPIVSIRGRSRPVTVLSESALVVLTKGVSKSRMGAMVSGVITYPNGNQDEVHGYIIFIKGKSIIVKLLKNIPIARINEQQRWVLQHYPNFDMRMK